MSGMSHQFFDFQDIYPIFTPMACCRMMTEMCIRLIGYFIASKSCLVCMKFHPFAYQCVITIINDANKMNSVPVVQVIPLILSLNLSAFSFNRFTLVMNFHYQNDEVSSPK